MSDIRQFVDLRERWLDVLVGDDTHSIRNQLSRMAWKSAAFEALDHSRSTVGTDSTGAPRLNGILHDLIDEGFFAVQLTAIRRLSDSYPCLSNERGTWSLITLLMEMSKHAALFTRENVLKTTSNPDSVSMYNRLVSRSGTSDASEFLKCLSDRDFNRVVQFDLEFSKMIGRSPIERVQSDVLSPEFFNRLIQLVKQACDPVKTFVDKFIAHSAAPESRAATNADSIEFTLESIKIAQKTICQVASFLMLRLFGTTHYQLLAVPQYNLWAYVDEPLVASARVELLRSSWSSTEREWQNWTRWTPWVD